MRRRKDGTGDGGCGRRYETSNATVNLLMQLQRLDFQLSSKLDTAGGGKRLRLEDVKSASIQYNAALDWLDFISHGCRRQDLYRTATDIYKKVLAVVIISILSRAVFVRRASASRLVSMQRSSAQ